MSPSSTKDYQDNLRAAEIAAEWLVRLETEGAHCHAAFLEWVKQSPQHVREFLAVTQLSRRMVGIDVQRQIDVDALLRSVNVNVASLGKPHLPLIPFRSTIQSDGRRAHVMAWPIGIGVAAALTIAIGWPWLAPLVTGADSYVTGVGEQRTVKLSDGSVIYLNTRSRARVRLSNGARKIQLLEGEALFVVTHDATRPFSVTSGDTTVTALGTQFNVRRSFTGTVVSVVEGRVRVSEEHEGTASAKRELPMPQLLTAGEEVRVAINGHAVKKAAEPEAAIAWRQRRLVFHEDTLADVAAEFNRYNTLQVRVEGAAVRNKLLTGAFNADNPQGLLRFLEKDPSLRIDRTDEAVVIRDRESSIGRR